MPDWRAYLLAHLDLPACAANKTADTVSELAGHLEEHYVRLLSEGVPEPEALREVELLSGNWAELRREILAAKREEPMNDRVRQLWIPGLVTLTLANVALALLLRAHVPVALRRAGAYATLSFYLPWLLILPVMGAVGGYLARRGSAQGWRVYFAALLPAAILGGLFVLVLGFALLFDPVAASHIRLSGFLLGVAGWVVLPAIALVMGAALEGLLHRIARTKSDFAGQP